MNKLIRLRRSMLFMPGNNPSMIINADILGADSIILDLEDAVSIEEKDSARILVREGIKKISFDNSELVVRINPLDTYGIKDIEEIKGLNIDTILLPKANKKDVLLLDEYLIGTDIKIIPLIETAIGLENVFSIITASNRIDGVLLGGEDLTTDMGIKRTKEGNEIYYARCKVVAAAKAARISAIDTPFTDTNDFEGLEKDTITAKSIGMTGKAAINPRGINIIHKVFSPSEEEIRRAIKIMKEQEKAKEKGLGVFSLEGKMIDAPVISRAKNLIEVAKSMGLIEED